MQLSLLVPAVAVLAGAFVRAETHTIRFENKCGKGTPQLIQGGKVLSTGADYTVNGVFSAGIAYLQTGECLFNGENCSTLEMTLVNPTAPGAGSSTDISLIAPHKFNVPTSFSYFGGCDGQGTTCDSATCKTAFFQPDDNQVQVQCESNNVNLLITFCGDATASTASTKSSSSVSSIAVVETSSVATHTSVATHATSSAHVTATVSSVPSLVVESSIAAAASTAASSSAASVPSCKAGSRRRRRSLSPESGAPGAKKVRRHHARNAEAARRGPSL
ncbi:uncharacterized protein TRAVEDRAFT_69488 [Trametes versicolor FP-101664 SS1]|uniref:uncharacterized protein n=1 Tax=Trametes versicolor (strain FP-101664) TaxID=717944 RepID=UPI0004622188|nr:uncharacterized protein TRAVEDRAFT_69488 [Trametes versicolor FP-101664 SS1]EIW63513.1 hypothetical protein TRAVEDRAFT_69488 [Trametes versicolor FP-101664 SS1]